MIIDTKALHRLALLKWKTEEGIGNATRLSRTTLWRMAKGTYQFHPRTIGRLVKALNK